MTNPIPQTEMIDLRGRIDALDRRILALLKERDDLICEAAEIKSRLQIPARIDWRVDQVLTHVRDHGGKIGLDPDLIAAIWRLLIEAAIAKEENHLAEHKNKGGLL